MRKRSNRILRWVLLPVVVCAVMFGAELALQLPLLNLPAEQSGTVVLDLAAAVPGETVLTAEEAAELAQLERENGVASEEELSEEEIFDEAALDEEAGAAVTEAAPEGALEMKMGTMTVLLPYNGYIKEVKLIGEVSTSRSYHVSWNDSEGNGHEVTSFFTEKRGQDSVYLDSDVKDGIILNFPACNATLTRVSVENYFVLNPYRMMFFGLIATAIYLLIALRGLIGRKAEYGFLIVALATGLFMSICLPANVNLSFDDQIHYDNVQEISWGTTAYTTDTTTDMADMVWNNDVNGNVLYRLDTLTDEQVYYAALDAAARDNTVTAIGANHWEYTHVGYVTQAFGMAAARALGLPFHWQMIWARVANMLTYVLLCFFAVKALHRFKLVMAAIALMPTPMFLACNFSYDPTGTALCFLGIALVVDGMLDRQTKLSWQRALCILVCLALGSLIKVVYMPLMLLVLLLPRSKFDSNRVRIWFKSLAMVVCLVGLLSMVINVAGDSSVLEDSRGVGADSAGQMDFILHHPLTYLGYFFQYMWQYWSVYFIGASRTTLAYVGSITDTMSYISLFLLLMTAFTDNDPALNQRMNWKLRLSMFIIGGLVVGLIFTTMYIAYSPVGELDFGGVQARYLIPALPLFFMMLSPDGVENRMNKSGWHLFFCGANLLVLGVTCYLSIIKQYLM